MGPVVHRHELVCAVGKGQHHLGRLLVFPAKGEDPRHPVQGPREVTHILPNAVAEFVHRNHNGHGVGRTQYKLAVHGRRCLDALLDGHRVKVVDGLQGRQRRQLVLAARRHGRSHFADDTANIHVVADIRHGRQRVSRFKRHVVLVGIRQVGEDRGVGAVDVKSRCLKEGIPQGMHQSRAQQLQCPVARVIRVTQLHIL